MPAKSYKAVIEELMETVIRENGSDLHLSVGMKPVIRVDDILIPLQTGTTLTADDTIGIITELLSDEQSKRFFTEQEVDFSYNFNGKARFRGNGFFQQETVSIALRFIPNEIRTLEQLQLPQIIKEFTQHKQGFFLVVGPVGQGKTTTLAAMVDMINENSSEHIVTIEDPIEYMFTNKKSIVDQREVGVDTKNFHTGLMSAFRQDVDVIMLGEMRDLDTMAAAVTAGETGHLVFATLHTNNAAQTIDRIIDSFPAAQQGQIRIQLASSLTGIFSQRLVPRVSGGLVPSYELLINNTAVSNLIREARTHEIQTVIETSSELGMIDMNRSLAELVRKGEISPESAFSYALDPDALERLL